MKYKIDKSSGKKAYIQLYEQIKAAIISGIYPTGRKLPSKRTICDEAGVSVITAEHSLSLLCDEGYIESKERSGYFVIYRKADFLTDSPPGINESRKSAVSTGFHCPSHSISFDLLSKTMRRVLLDYGDRILAKSPNHGCPELISAISEYLRRSQNMSVKPEQIIIGAGSEYLYGLVAQLLGDKAFAVENPSYEKITGVYSAYRIRFEKLKLGSDGIKSADLSASKASVLHVTPFNSFPSGISATASKKAEYIHWARERNGYIIEDNYDSELTVSSKNEDAVFTMSRDENVIYLNSFTKTLTPSIRIGYMVLPKKLLSLFENKIGFYSCTVPVFEQYVVTDLIESGNFERHLNKIRRAKRKSALF